MRYYVQKSGDTVIAYGMSTELPGNVTEIGEDEYNNGIAALAEADKKAKEDAEAKAKAEAEARQKEAEERQKTIDDYVSKVKAGTVKIDDVPEEYRTEVNNIVNPPKSEAEQKMDSLQSQLDATTEALNTIMLTLAQ